MSFQSQYFQIDNRYNAWFFSKRTRLFLLLFVLLTGCLSNTKAEANQDNANVDFQSFQAVQQGEEIPNISLIMKKISILTARELSPASIFKVHLEPVPQEYVHQVALIYKFSIYIYGFSSNYQNVDLLAMFPDVIGNDVKVMVREKDNQILLWSQAPFRALEQEVILEWDGNNLIEVFRRDTDPTQEILDQQKKLIEDEKWAEVAIPEDLDVQYPNFYFDFNQMGIYALKTAHKIALEKYRNKELPEAIEIMEWGLNFYFNAYPYSTTNQKDRFDIQNPENYSAVNLQDYYMTPIESLSPKEIALYLNDYAFFLSETGHNQKAEPFLLKVIELDPERVVAYINTGDVFWNLGCKELACDYYQKYVDLLGEKNPRIPSRVRERLDVAE